MSCGWGGFTCSNVSNRFDHNGICLNDSQILLLGGRNRKDETCHPIIIDITKNDGINPIHSKTHHGLTKEFHPLRSHQNTQPIPKTIENVTTRVTNSIDTGKKSLTNVEKGYSVTTYEDVPYIFGNEDSRHVMACCYDQKHKLLFIGGGFDTKKGDVSRRAGVLKYDGRQFNPAFGRIGDLPTTANVGCSVSFNITSTEEAVYLFGGQEDWRDTEDENWHDPQNNFSNRLFRQDLKNGSWKELHTQGAGRKVVNIPSPRSQSFCFVRKDQLYIYGGYNGSNLLSDLYRLDLPLLEWYLVKTNSMPSPKTFAGLLKPPDLVQPVNYKPLAAISGRHLFVVEENFELFHFDLNTNVWNKLPSNILIAEPGHKNYPDKKTYLPQSRKINERRRMAQHLKSRRGAHLVIGDKTLYVTGGEDPNSNNDRLIISYYNLPRKLDWSIERLLWLACFKNNVERDNCFLSQCPPMIMYKIVSYINSDIFII